MRKSILLGIVLGLLINLGYATTGCKTVPTNGDSFYQVVVTCTEANTSNAQAGAAVLECLTVAVNGDYSACLAGLVTAGKWGVDEIACIVRQYASAAAVRINSGTPKLGDAEALKNANAWIKAEKIGYR